MICQKLCKLEDGMKWMAKEIKTIKAMKIDSTSTGKEELIEAHNWKQISVNRIPAKNAYQYGWMFCFLKKKWLVASQLNQKI